MTPEEIASALRRRAAELMIIASNLRDYADELSPPDLPEPSRSSHHSG